ncbi:hypothetical protein BC332_15779 [Capsicum chinense]|nr:hypothetical protein BC332_15779 [Capsicum chinense]
MSSLLVGKPVSKNSYNLSLPSSSLCGHRGHFCKISSSLSLDDDCDRHIQIIHAELIPKHVAVLMDGNRRWAKTRGLPVQEGHKFLTPNLKNICNVSNQLGIQVISAFAFSTENWNRSKTSSIVVAAKLMYSASAELLDTVDCFLDFHEIKEFPIFTAYPVTDFLVRGHAAQSTSQYAEIVLSVLLDNNIPCPEFFLMYLTILKETSM